MNDTVRAKKIVLIAMLSASLTGAKLALMALPNIEVVTVLLLVYTVIFGLEIALPVSIIFVTTETLIFGSGYWVVLYYIHWPLLVTLAYIVFRLTKQKCIFVIALGILMTAFFGIESSLIDSFFALARVDESLLRLFKVKYLSGISFFVTHIISNLIIIPLLFYPLKIVLARLKRTYLF